MSAEAATQSGSIIDELEQNLASGDAQHCENMLARVADLFVAGSRRYSDQQIALFDDVLLRLSAEIEMKAKAKLSQRLAFMDNAPPKLIRSLAFDDAIDVARPVLSFSPRLSDADLVENAKSKSQDHLYAIGRRLKLSEAITDVLVERGNERVVRSLTRNSGARFSSVGYGKLAARAAHDCVLAFGIVERDDVPRQYLIKLIETASTDVRQALETAHPEAMAVIRDAVDEVARALRQEAREASREHAAAVREAERRSKTGAVVTEANVRNPARAQHFEKTVVALAKLGPFPVDLVERALLDEGADMVLILAKAAGCSWFTTKEMLLMFAAKRTLSAHDLSAANARFERLSPETARRIITFREQRIRPRPQADEQGPSAANVTTIPSK
jgi:uncharacterized protein (DUF2336 family)